jgi:recombination protein RecA
MSKKEKVVAPSWEITAANLEKKLGKTKFFKLNTEAGLDLEIDSIPSGSISLDIALGTMGYPRGRIIEIFGPESAGKSSSLIKLIAQQQKKQPLLEVAYIDLEYAFDKTWAAKMGVNFDTFWLGQPDGAEEALNTTIEILESGSVPLVVIDSVAALSSEAEKMKEVGESAMGKIGFLMGQFCRKAIPLLKRYNSTLVCANQTRSKLGGYGGETTPGGDALKFFASQRVRVRKAGDLVNNGVNIGIDIEVNVKKNKVAPPFKTAIVPLLFDRGISSGLSLLDTASDMGIIIKAGSWYSYKEDRLPQGRLPAGLFIEDNQELMDQIYNDVKEKLLFPCEEEDEKKESELECES